MEKRWARKLYYRYVIRATKSSKNRFPIPYRLRGRDRVEFEWRAHYFLSTTDIEFRDFDNSELLPFARIRLLIASVAAQMSFRLPDNCFLIYNRIIVYPDYYYSRVSKQYHKGETNPSAGLMVFSLRGITEGFHLPFDGVNLLYHEMAHALYLEHKGMSYDLFDEKVFGRFEQYAAAELNSEQGEDYFLRAYALTNAAEFFAVATENFFENPHNFSKALPDLYAIMQDLYRHNPMVLKS